MQNESENQNENQNQKENENEKETTINEEKEKCYKDRSVWMRGLFMLLFVFLMGMAKFVTMAVVLLQFLLVLFTGKVNENLLGFGKSLSVYQYQVVLFLTYNSEVQPFPMSNWPEKETETL